MRSFTFLVLLLFLSLNLPGQIFIMDGSPITSCGGFFMDSGGGNADYSPNENFTTTICSDGSSGTHIRLNFSGVNIAGGDLLCFYDGTDITAPQLSCHDDFLPGAPFIIQATAANPSGCLTITFTSDAANQSDGFSADISCIPSCQTILAVLTSTNPVISPPDTGYIDICPGDRVFFNATGQYPQDGVIYNHSDATSGFFWNFGDGNSAVGPNTSHIFEEPGGYVVELEIIDQFGCTNTNFISQRIRVSTYPDFELAGDIPDEICAGDTISLHANVSNIDSTFEVSVTPTQGGFPTGGVRSDSLALPDGTGVTLETSIIFNNFSPGQVLTDINDLLGICVNMEHSWMHDLQIELMCPDGTTVVLQQQVFEGQCFLGIPNEADEGLDPPLQGTGWDYCWTPTATNGNWTQYWQNTGVGTLPEGDYNAFGDLSDFLGCPLNGEWTIIVQDLWGIDNGWIFEWSIDFAPDLYPDIEVYTPELVDWGWEPNSSIVFMSDDSITAALNNAGNPSYTFTVTDNFGCSYDTTVVVDVLPPTHPNCYTCESLEPVLNDTIICSGETLSFDASPEVPLEDLAVTFESFSNVEFDGDVHPPGNPIESTVNVSFINPGILNDPLTQIESVCVNIEHSYDADVEIRLRAPNGVIIELSTDNGGSGDDYINACFSPNAATPITSGAPPFTGDWQPEGNWADLTGSDVTGVWTLLVSDDQNGFDGVFIDWQITFNTENDINYFWTPAGSLSCNNCPDPVASPSATTDYIVNITDIYGCVAIDTVTVEVLSAFPAPQLSCGLAENGNLTIDWLSVPGATDYEVSFDGGVTWLPANGTLSHTVSGLSIGEAVNIMVQVVSMNTNCPPMAGSIECIYTESCIMTVDVSAQLGPSCYNTSDGSVIMTTANAIPPIAYALDNGPAGPNFVFSGLAPGEHTVVATDSNGCTDSVTFELIAPDTIFLNLATVDANCNSDCDGQSTALATGGNGAFDYVWNTIPATNTSSVSNLCTGNYSVTATDANGCTAFEMTTVAEPDALVVTMVDIAGINCFGAADGSIAIGVNGGTYPYSYDWDDPANQTDSIATGLDVGPYSVIITDDNGCTAAASGSVTEAVELTATINQTFVACNGSNESTAEVIASGGTGSYQYLWSNGATTAIADDLNPINQSVTITDDNGCTTIATIQITELDAIIIELAGTDPSCFNGTDGEVSVVSVNGGASGYSYEWNTVPPQTGTDISGLNGNANYSLTVTDAEGCTAEASFNLSQPNEIQLSFETSLPSCNGQNDGTATVQSVTGGTPGYTYLWDGNAGNQSTPTANALGSGIYTVTVSDANGCTTVSQVEVNQPQTMQLVFQASDNFCPGQNDGSINVNVLGGTPNYTFLWENGASTQSIDSLWSGTYYLTVTDANGCFVIDSSDVNGPPPLGAEILVEDVSCFGADDGSIVISLDGGSPPYQYSLDNINFTGSNILQRLEGGEYNLYAIDVNGCRWSGQATIESPEEFEVNAGADVEILLGDSTELIPGQYNGNGFVDFTWIPPYEGTLNCEDSPIPSTDCNTPFASPQNTIIYELYGIDANGCEDTDMITVRVIKERDIYVATGFTPNGDGNNDLLMVHGPENTVVKLFRVYDRWGNMVYEYDAASLMGISDVLVNEPDFGWDGNFREEPMNPGVFIWYVEVEYIDGFRNIFKGNTTLIR